MDVLLNLKSILLASTAAWLAVGLGLLLYERYREVCPGFHQLVAGALVLGMGRALEALLPFGPDPSLQLGMQLRFLSSVFVLDGVCRYQKGRPLDWRWYVLPCLALLGQAGISPASPPAQDLTWLGQGGATLLGLAAGLLWLRPGPPSGWVIRWSAALFQLTLVAARAAGAALEVLGPVGLPRDHAEAALALVGGIMGVANLAVYVMLDGRRLEDRLLASRVQLEGALENLQQNLTRVKMLTGILPICSGCRKIRDEEGGWTPVETYVAHRTQARLSPSLCPRCRETEAGAST